MNVADFYEMLQLQEHLGTHYILDLCDCDSSLLNDPEYISLMLKHAIVEANATLIDELKYEFTPQGITMVCLLSESHISIHTWPEKSYAAVDIFTCGDHTSPSKAGDFLKEAFKSTSSSVSLIKRGIVS